MRAVNWVAGWFRRCKRQHALRRREGGLGEAGRRAKEVHLRPLSGTHLSQHESVLGPGGVSCGSLQGLRAVGCSGTSGRGGLEQLWGPLPGSGLHVLVKGGRDCEAPTCCRWPRATR